MVSDAGRIRKPFVDPLEDRIVIPPAAGFGWPAELVSTGRGVVPKDVGASLPYP
jgi:hypothetical protein